MQRIAFILCTVTFALSASAGAQTSAAPQLGTNLLINGDAEANFGASDASRVVKPSRWETTGEFSVVQYGAKGEFPDNATPGSTNGELEFFAGGNAALSTATQAVSLAPFTSQIDSGNVKYELSGKLGGFGALDDSAAVDLSFLDATGKTLASDAIGPVNAQQRLLNTALLNEQAGGTVPKGTRSAIVKIVLTRAGADGYNHGFADVVSLVLHE
ncbi:MAG TPA: hypothetical protein VGG89_05580 [Candidatus Baltobacteraceae bacterium]|jgi:hypothetical protein